MYFSVDLQRFYLLFFFFDYLIAGKIETNFVYWGSNGTDGTNFNELDDLFSIDLDRWRCFTTVQPLMRTAFDSFGFCDV